ncbi:MAG TPA: cell shape determination protein CcmA [Comamonadaceae bacterium]|uniref:bactofilin family protein n=1 Tax=Pulveribacter sp. TaxID=2678893 RepID=UPI000EEBCACC|nr:polymer-forming cytoskeletal protein [Pulveribacter sp.]HCL85508.1 cell shape determination protein CcmA [Comamonadaceae bacterium]
MAVQNPFFGKRDSNSDSFSTRQPTTSSVLGGTTTRPGSVSTASTPAASMTPSTPTTTTDSATTTATGGSKLTVGPNIKLKGVEITDCDTLVVEGTVEATMDSRVIHIAEQGAFRGSAEIDIAEIHGQFDGQLTVREKLVIFGSGRVSGKIRYGKVVIEEGGQLSGEIEGGLGSNGSSSARATSGSSGTSHSSGAGTASALAAV